MGVANETDRPLYPAFERSGTPDCDATSFHNCCISAGDIIPGNKNGFMGNIGRHGTVRFPIIWSNNMAAVCVFIIMRIEPRTYNYTTMFIVLIIQYIHNAIVKSLMSATGTHSVVSHKLTLSPLQTALV